MLLLIRASLVLVQALSNHLAFSPPNKSPEKGRYHNEAYVLKIFKLQSMLLWCIAALELVYAFDDFFGATIFSSLSAHLDTAVCPATRSRIITPLFLTGVLLTVVGMSIRIKCFQELGQLFTFDLSILPDHKLVTSGPYHYIRHPAYTGSLLIVGGIALSHLSAGSLAAECSVLGSIGSKVLWTLWWTWALSVAVSRAVAEDKELRKMFGAEWDAYSASTRSWFLPGVC